MRNKCHIISRNHNSNNKKSVHFIYAHQKLTYSFFFPTCLWVCPTFRGPFEYSLRGHPRCRPSCSSSAWTTWGSCPLYRATRLPSLWDRIRCRGRILTSVSPRLSMEWSSSENRKIQAEITQMARIDYKVKFTRRMKVETEVQLLLTTQESFFFPLNSKNSSPKRKYFCIELQMLRRRRTLETAADFFFLSDGAEMSHRRRLRLFRRRCSYLTEA